MIRNVKVCDNNDMPTAEKRCRTMNIAGETELVAFAYKVDTPRIN